MSFFRDLRLAYHSLKRSKSLAAIVILTLALGIGANAAIFTLVRGVLLKPLVNRDESRLVYIRQSAPTGGQDNTTFSVPEIKDIEGSVRSLDEFGDFSQMDFTMVGLGEPRVVHGGVVSGNFFDVMGLRPVLGRLVGPQDAGVDAPGVIVLTYRFWSTVYKQDPNVIGKTVRLSSLGDRSATVIGVLEPSVPYPAETEIIGNLVISPHHLSATMVTGRIHRMTELFGKLAPGATLDQARNELRTVYAGMVKDHADAYPDNAGYRIDARMLRCSLRHVPPTSTSYKRFARNDFPRAPKFPVSRRSRRSGTTPGSRHEDFLRPSIGGWMCLLTSRLSIPLKGARVLAVGARGRILRGLRPADRTGTVPRRFGVVQLLMLVWPDLSVRNASKKSCWSSAFSTSSCTERTT